MIDRMKWGAKIGQSLFYGQRNKAMKDNPDYRGSSLSRWTTDWGCAQPVIRQEFFRTIWVSYKILEKTFANGSPTAIMAK